MTTRKNARPAVTLDAVRRECIRLGSLRPHGRPLAATVGADLAQIQAQLESSTPGDLAALARALAAIATTLD